MKKIVLFFFFIVSFIAVVNGQSLPALIPYFEGNKWGYADSNGNVMIKPQWRVVYFFSNGRAEVYTDDSHCIIDTNGTYIIPPYRQWNGKFYTSLIGSYYNAKGKTGKYGTIDSNNHELLPCLYDKTEFGNGFLTSGYFKWDLHQNKYAAKASKNGKLGIVDTLNRVLIPFEYDGIDMDGAYPFSSPKYYVMQKNGKMGVIDAYDRTIIPAKYRNVHLDEHNDNQIMLFKDDRTSVIADTNGKITWDIPGYMLGFPAYGLVAVENSNDQWGVMNHDHKLVIPCEYLGAGIQHDTIVVSKWSADSGQNKVQLFKYLDVHTLREMSDWISYEQLLNLPDKELPPALNSKLPNYIKLHIQGKDLDEYRKGDIRWYATDYPKIPGYYIPVRGIAINDTVARYAAIIDSNGNYMVAPVLTENKLKVINAADSLVLIETTNKDSFQSVADFSLKTILPFQQFAIADAFYYNDTFYAITTHDYKHSVFWHSFEGGGTSEAHDYTYFLVTADGKPARGTGQYKLHGYTDSIGRFIKTNKYASDEDDKFNAVPFEGYFIVEDSLVKRGIVDIYGAMQLPALSFKYNKITSISPAVFLVDNTSPVKQGDYYNDLFEGINKPVKKQEKGLLRGLPYIVNRENKVLLDSLSIEVASKFNDMPLYYIGLKRHPNDYSGDDYISFYMNEQGVAYHGTLPGDKKSTGGSLNAKPKIENK